MSTLWNIYNFNLSQGEEEAALFGIWEDMPSQGYYRVDGRVTVLSPSGDDYTVVDPILAYSYTYSRISNSVVVDNNNTVWFIGRSDSTHYCAYSYNLTTDESQTWEFTTTNPITSDSSQRVLFGLNDSSSPTSLTIVTCGMGVTGGYVNFYTYELGESTASETSDTFSYSGDHVYPSSYYYLFGKYLYMAVSIRTHNVAHDSGTADLFDIRLYRYNIVSCVGGLLSSYTIYALESLPPLDDYECWEETQQEYHPGVTPIYGFFDDKLIFGAVRGRVIRNLEKTCFGDIPAWSVTGYVEGETKTSIYGAEKYVRSGASSGISGVEWDGDAINGDGTWATIGCAKTNGMWWVADSVIFDDEFNGIELASDFYVGYSEVEGTIHYIRASNFRSIEYIDSYSLRFLSPTSEWAKGTSIDVRDVLGSTASLYTSLTVAYLSDLAGDSDETFFFLARPTTYGSPVLLGYSPSGGVKIVRGITTGEEFYLAGGKMIVLKSTGYWIADI